MPRLHRAWFVACVVVLAAVCPPALVAQQGTTSPRLRHHTLPSQAQMAVGGGEVVLELTVDVGGTVTQVTPLTTTPPFSEALAAAAHTWRFESAIGVRDGRRVPVPGRVLVVGVFRPPTLYGGPTIGPQARVQGRGSPDLPEPGTFQMPAYPPNARGDGVVLVEIEMTARAAVRDYRVVSEKTGFDSAALDAAKAWRFSPPRTEASDRLFIYVVFGFRTPIAPGP